MVFVFWASCFSIIPTACPSLYSWAGLIPREWSHYPDGNSSTDWKEKEWGISEVLVFPSCSLETCQIKGVLETHFLFSFPASHPEFTHLGPIVLFISLCHSPFISVFWHSLMKYLLYAVHSAKWLKKTPHFHPIFSNICKGANWKISFLSHTPPSLFFQALVWPLCVVLQVKKLGFPIF